jgi:hypothetical protein
VEIDDIACGGASGAKSRKKEASWDYHTGSPNRSLAARALVQ